MFGNQPPVRVAFLVPRELADRLLSAMDTQGESASAIARKALAMYLDSVEKADG
jgi:hypothetical protein